MACIGNSELIENGMMSNSHIKEVEIESLYTIYRKLLLGFTGYLQDKGKEKAFKMFLYGSIPSKYWAIDIEEFLLKLEQSDIANMNHLEILSSFLKSFDDSESEQMSLKISEFKRLLDRVKMILKYGSAETSEGKSTLFKIFLSNHA